MNSRSKKIFWGLLIASLHIDLFGLVLLPACFGFAILYFGIYDLEKGGASFPLTQRQMIFYHALAAALVLLSGIIVFTSIIDILPDSEVWEVLPCVLEYIVCFVLMEVYAGRKPSLAGLKRGYAVVMGLALIGYWASLFVGSAGWQIFSSVIILICRVMVLTAAYSDRKYEASEPLEEKSPLINSSDMR